MDLVTLHLFTRYRSKVYNNPTFYPTLFAVLIWVFTIILITKNYSMIKSFLLEKMLLGKMLRYLIGIAPLPLKMILFIQLIMILSQFLFGIYNYLFELYYLIYSIDLSSIDITSIYNSMNNDLALAGVSSGPTGIESSLIKDGSKYNVFLASRGNEDTSMGGTEDVSMGGTDNPTPSRPSTPPSDIPARSSSPILSRIGNVDWSKSGSVTPTQESVSSTAVNKFGINKDGLCLYYVTRCGPPEPDSSGVVAAAGSAKPVPSIRFSEDGKILSVDNWHLISYEDKARIYKSLTMEQKIFCVNLLSQREKIILDAYVKGGFERDGIVYWPNPPIPLEPAFKYAEPPVTSFGDGRDQYPWRMKRPQLMSEFDKSWPSDLYDKNPNKVWPTLGTGAVSPGESNIFDCGFRGQNHHEWQRREFRYYDLHNNPYYTDRNCARCEELLSSPQYHCDWCGNRICSYCKISITWQGPWRFDW
jgi:hypothetical protein